MSQSTWPSPRRAPAHSKLFRILVVVRHHERAGLVARPVRVRKDALGLIEGRQAVRVEGLIRA